MEESPFDIGWRHGTEDIGEQFRYRPDRRMTNQEYDEYRAGYKEARRGWADV